MYGTSIRLREIALDPIDQRWPENVSFALMSYEHKPNGRKCSHGVRGVARRNKGSMQKAEVPGPAGVASMLAPMLASVTTMESESAAGCKMEKTNRSSVRKRTLD